MPKKGIKQNRFICHFKEWESFYNFFGHILLIIIIIINLVSFRQSNEAINESKKSVIISYDAIKISRDALNLQKREFYIRNRPLIAVRDMAFSGHMTTLKGKQHKHTIFFGISNLTSIPANNIKITADIIINDVISHKTIYGPKEQPYDEGTIAIPPDSHSSASIGVSEFEYFEALNTNSTFKISIEVIYSGIFDSSELTYKTKYVAIYNSVTKRFKMYESFYQ